MGRSKVNVLLVPAVFCSLVFGCGRSEGLRSADGLGQVSNDADLSSVLGPASESESGVMALSLGSDLLADRTDFFVVQVVDSSQQAHKQVYRKSDNPVMMVKFDKLALGPAQVVVRIFSENNILKMEGTSIARIEEGKVSEAVVSLQDVNQGGGSLVVVVKRAEIRPTLPSRPSPETNAPGSEPPVPRELIMAGGSSGMSSGFDGVPRVPSAPSAAAQSPQVGASAPTPPVDSAPSAAVPSPKAGASAPTPSNK